MEAQPFRSFTFTKYGGRLEVAHGCPRVGRSFGETTPSYLIPLLSMTSPDSIHTYNQNVLLYYGNAFKCHVIIYEIGLKSLVMV